MTLYVVLEEMTKEIQKIFKAALKRTEAQNYQRTIDKELEIKA